MDNSAVQLVGTPCGQHGPYTFYKAFKYVKNGLKRLVKLSEFFFVKLWTDSDLVCIGELQLLWIDKNSEQVLSSLRLYFLPENTPEGRMDHGEDEVLAISEKVVLRLDDLVTWITTDAEWTWGRLANCEADVKPPKYNDNEKEIANVNLNEGPLDFSDIEREQNTTDEQLNRPTVIILSYPSYCRYRAIMRRLEGVENEYLKHTVVKVLGGFTTVNKNTRVLFCRDTFDYPELEGHELLCNHLAPKLKGRPRGRRKKRSLSPGSESNESESSVCNIFNSNKSKLMTEGNSNGLRSDNIIPTRRSTRASIVNTEGKEFLKKLTTYMKSIHTPIGRIPSLGFKELDLHSFFTKVNKLGGYNAVTKNRLWKSIFDDLSGNYISTSAATVIRRHYERFLLPYELYLKGEEYKLSSSSKKSSKSHSGSGSDADTSESTSCSGKSTPIPQLTVIPIPSNSTVNQKEIKEPPKLENPKQEIKTSSSLRSVRVKPERLRDQSTKDRAAANEKLTNTIVSKTKMANEFSIEIKTELEASSTKISENNLLNNGLTVELITTALPTIPQKNTETEVSEIVTDKVNKSSVTIESIKTEKTSTFVGSFQNSDSDKSDDGKENIATCNTNNISSAQCKSTEVDLIEVPCKPNTPESVHLETDCLNNISSTSFINKSLLHSVKKRKLDILKEGGLEVTPVKPTTNESKEIKELRPSVIHQNLGVPKATVGQLSITLAVDKSGSLTSSNGMEISQRLLPPPQAKDIQSLPSTSIMRTSAKSSNKSLSISPSNSFLYLNGQSPPKVVQSRSIYSYSEKTVYGNPKDYFMPPPRPPPQTPKSIEGFSKYMGGDILDLTTKSPQKPIVEIMRVPTVASRAPMGLSELSSKRVPKNSASLPVLDARVGSNLEITLVGANTSQSTHTNKPINRINSNSINRTYSNGHTLIPTPTSYSSNTLNTHGNYNIHNKVAQKRTFNGNYVLNKKQENGRLPYSITPAQHAYAPRDQRQQNHLEYNTSNPYTNSRSSVPKLDNTRSTPKVSPQSSSNLKPYASTPTPALPGYLSQLSMASKMVPPYVPPIDPIYFSALQSLYPHTPLSSVPPFFPLPTPDHLQFYTDLMARNSHMRYPFPFQQQDSNSSVTTANTDSNSFKKQ